MTHPLASLRKSLACAYPAAASETIALGAPALDRRLGGGILRAALHEAYAETAADAPAATGFALALARRAMAEVRDKPLLWIRQEALTAEAGVPYPPGLADIGVDPAAVAFIRVRDAKEALQVGAEAGRCATVGATLIELFGAARAYDLTASRRLALAAAAAGAPIFIVRAGSVPAPSAAASRWLVRALPSRPRPANAPGSAAFAIFLLRRRGGAAGQEQHAWRVEWSRDRGAFKDRTFDAPSLSRAVASFPVGGATGEVAPQTAGRKFG
jgi:protein ImuA